ncbi:hypothetical protein HHI36_014542 [Cryptolaemus montrouzieri]|uniref:Uncharacterized protein n=1 Tax=Cryptolaemus montrouzieri TaxID=559131 RepID=A0ABD2N3T4_9CUCU
MLPKDNSPKKTRSVQNSPNLHAPKRKTSYVQTDNLNCLCFVNGENLISKNGDIPKNAQHNYRKAVEYVNKWNQRMNEYIKNIGNEKQTRAKVQKKSLIDDIKITSIPNFMTFFMAIIKQPANEYSNSQGFELQNSLTQTKPSSENINLPINMPSKSRNYISLSEITEDVLDDGNISELTKNILESQYKSYPRRIHSYPKSINNNTLPSSFKKSSVPDTTRHNEWIIQETVSNTVRKDLQNKNEVCSRPTNNLRCQQSPSLRRNQSFGAFPTTPPNGLYQKQLPTGFLSSNGMIASQINSKGTPLMVKNMFEEIQHPLGIFVSKGNILKNISIGGDSSNNSSIILSDKDSKELKNKGEQAEEENFFDSKEVEEIEEIDPHPLKLNERDLNTTDKDFINSIGIFTEAGELNQNAKTYLEKKEDVRRGTFRTPRVTQIHMRRKFNTKAYLSESLSDSSDIRFDD